MNSLLQQVESHLLKVSLVRLSSEMKRTGLNAQIVASIHDSIWVEAAVEEEPEVRRIITEIMTTGANLDVPLEVDLT
jgi:DNA polymerase-1